MKTDFIKKLIGFCKRHNIILVDGNKGFSFGEGHLEIPFVDEKQLRSLIKKETKGDSK